MIIKEVKLINVYKEMNGNIFDIAAELRVSVQTVMASLKKYKVDFVKPKHIYGDLKRTNFSRFQKSLLIGSILGDGHLEKRGHLKNALFRCEHAMKQVRWLKWKRENLKPFVMSNVWIRDRGEKALFPDGHGSKKLYNIDNVCAMSTITHPYLTKLHGVFYKDRKKVVPYELIQKEFDIISMVVLLGDDGCFTEDCIRWCTDSFGRDEVEFLSNIFSKFYKSRITIREEKKDKYRIVFTAIKKDKAFFDDVVKILPEYMHYKLPPVLNEHQAATYNE